MPSRLLRRLQRSRTTVPLVLAVLVGLLAGTGAIVLRWLITSATSLFFVRLPRLGSWLTLPEALEGWPTLVAPALGLVIVVRIVRQWSSDTSGHGIPEVQYAVRAQGGRIRPRVALVKAVTAAITIGSGGSVGREGPIVQIGSSLGSTVGQITGLAADQVKLLVACGAAAAVGATFNAPIAGVMFALEVILASFAARSFGLVVVAAVSATALSQAVLGNQPAYGLTQEFALVSPRELGLYLVLGALLGVVSTVYTRAIYFTGDVFSEWSPSATTTALVGGLAVGAMGLLGSELVLGSGNQGVEPALAEQLAMGTMLLLAALKIVATSITLAAGGSGGVFAPALFIGAMAGGGFGSMVHGLFPSWTATPGAYALVGMAAVIGGAAHAPITSVLVLFEMTDNYQIILPLMFSVVVSYLVASRLFDDSIYSLKLRRRGALASPGEVSTLDLVLVADAMSERFETVAPELSVRDLAAMASERRTRSWPVIDADGRLVGMVTETDLQRQLLESEGARPPEELMVSDVMTRGVTMCRLDDSLRVAFRRFAERDVQQVPVVDPDDPERVVGVLRRHDMLWAHRELADEHQKLLDASQGRVRDPSVATCQMEVQIPEGNRTAAGRLVRDLTIPEPVLIALVRRAARTFVPRGDTRLDEGDVLVLLSTEGERETLEELAQHLGSPG